MFADIAKPVAVNAMQGNIIPDKVKKKDLCVVLTISTICD